MRIDLKRDRKDLYLPSSRDFVEVDVPPQRHLAIDGHGDPNTSPEYLAAVQALYAIGYGVRATFHDRTGDEFVVGPLAGLWSSSDPGAFVRGAKQDWDWTMMLPLPDPVADADVERGTTTAAARKPTLPVNRVTVLELSEGRCLQILHIGPYDAEAPTLARLHREVMPERGLTWNGRHHEIYLSDPRRTASERLRTVLRQPVRPID